uniref:(northern house mosquito) hypothetical protein n=1 Tax=Culex pipiens TaxID=7175 RepID=A0A8D8P6E0_CULPI
MCICDCLFFFVATFKGTSYFGLYFLEFLFFAMLLYIITFFLNSLLVFTICPSLRMCLCVCLLVVLFVYTIYLYYFTRCMPSFSPTFRVFLFNQLCSAFFEALLCTHIYNWREFSKSSCQSDFSFATTGGFHWRFYCQGWGEERLWKEYPGKVGETNQEQASWGVCYKVCSTIIYVYYSLF